MRKYKSITITDIDKLLEFQPVFSRPDFKAVRGGGFGYVDYVPEVEEFYRLVTQPHWCDYQYSPEEVQKVIFDPEYIAQSNLFQIKSMLTYCQRGERFCDGHRGGMIEDGVVGQILNRLSEIKEEDLPKQNRVAPTGELIMTPARGQFMGNRGVLHNEAGELTSKRWTHQQWIICKTQFKDRKRELMPPGCYTELFFLDEATALSAGHRPCFECNRERYNQFRTAWLAGNPEYGFDSKVSIKQIDRIIHSERVDRKKQKVTWSSKLKDLPDGVMISFCQELEECFLLKDEALFEWSPYGYEEGFRVGDDAHKEVFVLTPKSVVNAIDAGFEPLTCRLKGEGV